MIFGHHTLDELIDIVAAKNDDMGMLAELRASHPQITSVDPKWDADYATLKGRYDAAHKIAKGMVEGFRFSPTPNSLIPAEDAYQGILRAVSPIPNTVTPGSLADLSVRLGKVGARPPPGWQVTQPKADALRDLNVAAHTIQDVAKAPFEGAAGMLHDIAEGTVKEGGKIAKAPFKGVGEAVGLPWWVIALFGLGGVYLLYRGVRAAAPAALRVAEVVTPQGRALTAVRAVSAALGTSGAGGGSAFQQRVHELQAAEGHAG